MRAGVERGDIPRDVDIDGAVTMLMVIADGVWWRRALDPDFDPQSVLPVFMDITRHMLRTRAGDADARRRRGRDESEPHYRDRPGGRRRALDRLGLPAPARARRKPRRDHADSAKPEAVPRRRRRHHASPRTAASFVLSGRTEADRKVTVVARTGGVLTELRVRRGDRVEKGDVIAVLSDEAREAQVAQALALVAQRKAELEAKRRLIESGTLRAARPGRS